MFGHQDHPVGEDTLDLARSQIDQHAHLAPHDLFGREALGNARDHRPPVDPRIDGQFEQFLGLGHLFGLDDGTHADVHPVELVVGNGLLLRLGRFLGRDIGQAGVFQTFELRFDGGIFDLFEQEGRLSQTMPRGNDRLCLSHFVPSQRTDVQHLGQGSGGKRQERLAEGSQSPGDLHRSVHHGFGTFGIGLLRFPRLVVRQVLVAQTSEVHHLGKGLAETVFLDRIAQDRGILPHLVQNLAVGLVQVLRGRNHPAVVLVREDHHTVYEVAQDSDQLAVVAVLEIPPGEVVVLGFGSGSDERIAQDVLFARKIDQILVQPYGPVARGGQLVALQVEELVGRDVVREDVFAVRPEHGREDDAVEDDVVLADEVHQFGIGRFPVRFPVLPFTLGPFLGRGNVADRGVEPDVQHLAFGAFHRHGDTPVQVAGYRPGAQAVVEPGFHLAVHVGFPIGLMPFEDPLAQPRFVLLQGQVPVLGLFQDGGCPGKGALGIDEFRGAEGRSALLALVAVRSFGPATRAGTGDVTVGQELFRFGVVILFGLLLDELPGIVHLAEEFRCGLVVDRSGGPGVIVERDAELGKRIADDGIVLVHHLLRGDALAAGLDGDGHAVLVRSADEDHVASFLTEVAHIDIGRNIDSRQVSQVDRAVGIRQSGRYGVSFGCIHGIISLFFRFSFSASIRLPPPELPCSHRRCR